ncbi:hypothetical protein C0993_000932, partial [Termitomyces sp. T159_Od127]
ILGFGSKSGTLWPLYQPRYSSGLVAQFFAGNRRNSSMGPAQKHAGDTTQHLSTPGPGACYSAAFFVLGQYYAQPAPASPPPPQGYSDTYYLPYPQPPVVPPSHTPPSPLGRQRVKAYLQQHDEVLQLLCISLVEFARCAHALLVSLGHNDLSGTLEQWTNFLLKFHELHLCGAIPKSA